MSRGSAVCGQKGPFHGHWGSIKASPAAETLAPIAVGEAGSKVFSLRVWQEKLEKGRTRLGAPCKGRKFRELYCLVTESPCHQISEKAPLEEISLRSKMSGRLKKDESASLLHWSATTFWGYFVDVCKHLYAACSIGLQVA